MSAPLPWPVQDIADWAPHWQAAGFFFATFILEDVATLGAGLLLAAGAVQWPVAFFSCFIGIWMGDAGLYALARMGGRNWFERSPLRRFSGRVHTSEQWFVENGTPILIFSRLIPGARLPTYLAAGFLRWPLDKFLWVTGIASFIWTFVILALVHAVGEPLLDWLGQFKRGSYAVLVMLGLIWGLLYFIRRALRGLDTRSMAAAFARWRHWEFWPGWLFYPPVALWAGWLAIKYRGLTLPSISNPGMFIGGMVGESKMATLRELMASSPEFTAEAELLVGTTPGERLASLREIIRRRCLEYPFILKPDVGQRGAGVKLIRDESQAEAYLKQTAAPLLVQRYAAGPHEVGVFYYRFPDETKGHIFAITEKDFPSIIGDGKTTIEDLIWHDSRARLIAAKYLSRLGKRRSEILPAGQRFKLVEAGNHAQGCIFRDGMHFCTPALVERIDEISQKVPGFFFGRYDLRFTELSELQAGRGFQIIELNGAASEATNIYDARNSLFAAYRVLFRQWDLVFAIGAANRRLGHAPVKFSEFWRIWRSYLRQAETYPTAD